MKTFDFIKCPAFTEILLSVTQVRSSAWNITQILQIALTKNKNLQGLGNQAFMKNPPFFFLGTHLSRNGNGIFPVKGNGELFHTLTFSSTLLSSR